MKHTKYRLLLISLLLLCGHVALTATAQVSARALSPSDREAQQKYLNKASAAEQRQNPAEAAEAYRKLIRWSYRTNDRQALPQYLYQYGLMSSYNGQHSEAIDTLVSLLNLPTDSLRYPAIAEYKARAQMQLGAIYFFMEQWDDALACYEKAKASALALHLPQGVSIAENNIGNIYQKKGRYSEAILKYRSCLEIQSQIGDSATLCNTYFNLGTCNAKQLRYKEAAAYIDTSYSIASAIHDLEIRSLCLSEKAMLAQVIEHRYDKAVQYFDQAESIAAGAGYRQVLCQIYQDRSETAEQAGHAPEALKWYKQYKTLSDSLFNDRSIAHLKEYEMRYQTAEKQLEINRQSAVIVHQKMLRNILIGGLFVSLIILLFAVGTLRLRKKRNAELTEMNATKDKFFTIISHDLKNPAIAQYNALQMLVENGEHLDNDSLMKFYSELLKSSEMQVELLYNLLDWARVETGRIPFHPSTFDLQEVIRNESSLMEMPLENKHISYHAEIPEAALVYADRNMTGTIVRNLLSNAIKFTRPGGEIVIRVTDSGKYHTIAVSDNGIGMDAEKIGRLFALDRQDMTTGTDGEKGSGLGLIVCKELVESNRGKISVKSAPDQGTTFSFTLPKEA